MRKIKFEQLICKKIILSVLLNCALCYNREDEKKWDKNFIFILLFRHDLFSWKYNISIIL